MLLLLVALSRYCYPWPSGSTTHGSLTVLLSRSSWTCCQRLSSGLVISGSPDPAITDCFPVLQSWPSPGPLFPTLFGSTISMSLKVLLSRSCYLWPYSGPAIYGPLDGSPSLVIPYNLLVRLSTSSRIMAFPGPAISGLLQVLPYMCLSLFSYPWSCYM